MPRAKQMIRQMSGAEIKIKMRKYGDIRIFYSTVIYLDMKILPKRIFFKTEWSCVRKSEQRAAKHEHLGDAASS